MQRWAVTKAPSQQTSKWQQRGLETLDAPPIPLEGDNPSMTLADAQQQRLLERLHHAGGEPGTH
jgi:hypothetical protein